MQRKIHNACVRALPKPVPTYTNLLNYCMQLTGPLHENIASSIKHGMYFVLNMAAVYRRSTYTVHIPCSYAQYIILFNTIVNFYFIGHNKDGAFASQSHLH